MAPALEKQLQEASKVVSKAAWIHSTESTESAYARLSEYIQVLKSEDDDIAEQRDTISTVELKTEAEPEVKREEGGIVKVEDPELYVAQHLTDLLRRIDEASREDQARSPGVFSIALGDMKTVGALIDLIIIDCVYPALAPGVGLPLQKRLKDGLTRQNQMVRTGRTEILRMIVDLLVAIVASEDDLSDIIMGGQYATDIICGLIELGYDESHAGENQSNYRKKLIDFFSRIQTYNLLVYITTLMQKDSPPWFMAILTRTLAMIPVTRTDDGVKALIEMIGGLRDDEHISVEKLDRAAKILCSVPKGIEPKVYFSTVCSQLLAILDTKGQKLLVTSVIQVIMSMQKMRSRVVQDLIFSPILSSIAPPSTPIKSEKDVLVSDTDLTKAISRLSLLIRSADPETTSNLLSSLVHSLWGLMCFQKKTSRSVDLAKSLLSIYIKMGDADSIIEDLVSHLYYDGEKNWKFGDGDSGGVEIRKRGLVGTSQSDMQAGLVGIDELDMRVGLLMDLINEVEKAALRSIFLKTVRRWLARRREVEADPFIVFVDLRLLEGLLDKHKSEIIESPTEIITLVSSILDEYIESLDQKQQQNSKPLAEQLAEITKPTEDDEDADSDDEDEEKEEENTSSETVSVALSLLTAIVSESMIGTSSLSDDDQRILKSLGHSLKYIAEHGTQNVSSSAETLAILLNETDIPTARSKSNMSASQQTYQTALTNLQDPLIPVRAHGLHLLRNLIVARDPVINVSSVLNVYMNTLNDEDSFIYLNSIKGLQALTDVHGMEVIRPLIAKYTSAGKSPTLDERLRIGEAILRTIQRLGDALTGKSADIIMHAMISTVANRKLDTRLRSSALSILGMACEVNPIGIKAWVKDGIECALGVLTFEKTGDDKAPLRRAAVVLIGSLFKGVTSLAEFPKEFAKDVVRTMRYIRTSDEDALVRVQCGNVLDILGDMIADEFSSSLS
ncbi:hypothetical protein BZA70DRAFT_295279 [Myxozyma melibiosi]|uniref:RNA polymerase II assembly factor Rtp1 C-terminal domain-containing protein n=1 Tax=Myxozyma melibiosi TaxID=54550 RepID=A0ABR1F6M4_9ASCO